MQQPASPLDATSTATKLETTIFSLNNDYHKSLLYYELDADTSSDLKLNESSLKQAINSNEWLTTRIQSVYVLYGNRRLLIVAKQDADKSELNQHLTSLFNENKSERFDHLKARSIPFACGAEQPVLLVGELTDYQLRLINADDKNTALKAIESGLKLKKVKKTFYFTGLLFQFVILNEFLTETTSKLTSSDETKEKESQPAQSQVADVKQTETVDANVSYWLSFYNDSCAGDINLFSEVTSYS